MGDRKNKISLLLEQWMGKRKTWAIVLIIGLLLAVIVWPTSIDVQNGETDGQNAMQPAGTDELTYEEKLEEKLAKILSQVKGAGKVEVMITL